RPHAARHKVAAGPTRIVDAGLHVTVNVLHDHRFLLHADDFGNVRDTTHAALQAAGLNHEVDRAGNLLTHGLNRQFEAGHHDHGFHTGDAVARGIRVDRGERTFVTRVHGLQHVERFRTTAFADDDTFRPHTQGVADEIGRGDLALAFDVRGAGFESHHVI